MIVGVAVSEYGDDGALPRPDRFAITASGVSASLPLAGDGSLFLPWVGVRRRSRSVSGLQVGKATTGTTGLEPATSAVTGRRSNQLIYVPHKTVISF